MTVRRRLGRGLGKSVNRRLMVFQRLIDVRRSASQLIPPIAVGLGLPKVGRCLSPPPRLLSRP